ncbi:MAG: OmpA family protein [Acetobacteraceae bacterium]|nr:OmpA family protein [Acetobacteraceae bacterium]
MIITSLDLPRAGTRKTARRLGLLAATALAAGGVCAPSGAEAQPFWNAMPVTGLYVGAGIGANWVQKTDLEQSGSLTAALRTAGFPAPGGKASFDIGIVGLGSLGWGFGNGLRAEAELNYRWNNVDRVTGFGLLGATGRLAGVGGEQQTLGLMFNLLYDFQVPGAPWVVPYLGGGIGMAWTRWSSTEVRSIPADLRIHFGDTQYNFAYQAIAGAAFPIGSVPGLAVTTEFRYFGTLQNKFDASVTRISTGQTLGRGSVEADSNNWSLLVGVRYNFGRVPPPPPPAPPAVAAPEVARTYLVFFDWDRADLTDRARQIIADAAQASRRVQTTRIEVAGHADRSGSAQYNQRLSQRRADNVAAELVRNGVPRNEIVVSAYGETRPLVPTADGVREPQNRRVEIVLR